LSESRWRDVAAPIIRRILAMDLDPKAQRKALHDAYPFGERKYHPYKIWLDEIARQRGKKPPLGTLSATSVDPRQGKLF
jgi:hypothetical protein